MMGGSERGMKRRKLTISDVSWSLEVVFVCFLLLQVALQVSSQSVPVNVALNKPITANITCGLEGAEVYRAHSEILKQPADRVDSVCDATDPQLAHGPEKMVDKDVATGNVYTWWQSTSRTSLHSRGFSEPDTVITIDLQESYLIENIQIQMGDSVRPGQMGLFKSLDGISYTPWQYKVSDSTDCTSMFSVDPSTAPTDSNSVLCSPFSSQSLASNQVITFTNNPPTDLAEWKRATHIRFNFYNMKQSFGFDSNSYHHYTVRNIQVMAFCQCNGHASDCTLQPITDQPDLLTYQCECGGNTQGISCSQCLPFYNQQAYQTGENGFICQACNCFGHSDACMYDPLVGNVDGSLDVSGNFNGGGVCQDCLNFTAGINCQECQRFYYRPVTKAQTDQDACSPCNCHLPGTREDSAIDRLKGECVVNNDSPIPAGMSPGDCYCKVNVQGSKCDECADGFYDLTDANSNGCLSCNCFTAGTVSASNVCNKNASGQCPCKPFTSGRRCDQCAEGYYGLAADKPEGCSPCACDAGGAIGMACDSITGQCFCRNHVEGRQCSSVMAFSYYPSLHVIGAEFESIGHPNWGRDSVTYPGYSGSGYVTLTGQMSTTTVLTVPPSQLSGSFQFVLRAANEGPTQVDLTISPRGSTEGVIQRGTAILPLCASWCLDGIVQNTDSTQGSVFTLAVGQWDIQASINVQGGARILFDQVVALPVEFTDPSTVLGAESMMFTDTCNVYTNDMRLGTEQETLCLSSVFSLVLYYFEAAIPCGCSPTGSVSLQCQAFGGVCQCKPGVGGRACDMCLPEYYAFRSTGCTACDCFGDNKVCDMTTGYCDCPPNTAGQRCDRCVIFAWGLDRTNGCQLCECDPLGSTNLQCDSNTGVCTCQPGVGGMKCDQCLDGYQGLTSEGCTPCQCDPAGSLAMQCNKTTGQCLCKDLVDGTTCDRCMAGSFYNSAQHQSGCLQCVCMGITTTCDSSQDRITQYDVLTDSTAFDTWLVVSDIAAETLFPSSLAIEVLNTTQVLSISIPQGQAAYWLVPTSQLTGNLLALYGSSIHFSLLYTLMTPLGGGDPREARVSIKAFGGIFSSSIGVLASNSFQEFSIKVVETDFIDENSGATVDRSEFLKILTAVDGVFISASLSSGAHRSSIGSVSYQAATGPGMPTYDPRGERALFVEQCNCGSGYSGYSCEDCAGGYRRVNVSGHPFFGECVACDCNAHTGQCDPETGQCLDCKNNTTGFNCQRCADGFYGDATMGTSSDCMACPCSPPKATSTLCSLVDGILTCDQCTPGHLGPLCDSCDAFYYGQPQLADGFCTACSCNGNSDQCDTITGQCLNCASRTTGVNCELCQDFTFGNAALQNCQDCNCNLVGITSSLCNHTTGQCPCKAGIGGQQCDVCLPAFYGYSSQGCQACECSQHGSVSLQCAEDGSCACLPQAFGFKCDQCQPGTYGLPTQPCTACDCDVIGSVGGATAICDLIDGACPCKVGVGSRRCDQCLPTYVNFTITGCSKCDHCVETLQNSTLSLYDLWDQLWLQTSLLAALQQRDRQLEVLRPQANQTAAALTNTLSSLAKLRLQIEATDQQEFVSQVDDLVIQVGQALESSQTLLNNAMIELQRLQGHQLQAQTVLDGVLQANLTAGIYLDTLGGWLTMAKPLPANAQSRLDALLAVSYSSQRALMDSELARCRNVSMEAIALLATITSQASSSANLSTEVTMAEAQFTGTQQLVTSTHELLDTVEGSLQELSAVIQTTEAHLNYSSSLLAQSQDLLQRLDIMLASSQEAMDEGDQAFIDTDIIRLGSLRGSSGVPLDAGIDQRGQNGWQSVHSQALTENQVVATLQPTIETMVLGAEAHVTTLTQTAGQAESIFNGVQLSSTQAVDVVTYYQDTVTTISQSQAIVQAASQSLGQTQQGVSDRTLTALQDESLGSKEESAALLSSMSARNTDPAALEESLVTANATLLSTVASGESIAANLMALQTDANALSQVASDPQIQPAITQGLASASLAITTSQDTLSNLESLNVALTSHKYDIQAIRENIDNASRLLAEAPSKVSEAELSLSTLSQKTDTVLGLQNQTGILRSSIQDRMARLKQKLSSVQERIAGAKQPANFPGLTSVELQRASPLKPTLYNQVKVNFKTDRQDGLVFFTENNVGGYFSLELVSGMVQFTFKVKQEPVIIQSPIDACCGEWYSVLATRYGNEGQLSVVQQSTGGSSTSYNHSAITYGRDYTHPNITSFYIGGLPSSYQTTYVRSRSFVGCISDASFDNQELNVWQPSSQEGSVLCCQRPAQPSPPDPQPSLTPGISFSGFGYLKIPRGDFDIMNSASITLDLQTSLSESVLIIATSSYLLSYIGIFMMSGNLMFEMNTASNTRYTIQSLATYNDARWYRVNVAYNSSHYSMDIRYANQTDVILESFSKRSLAPLSFPNLHWNFKLLLGSPQDTNSPDTVRGPTSHRFAGCMRNLKLSSNTSPEPVYRPLTNTTDGIEYQEVSFNGCRADIVAGIGLAGQFAFAQFQMPEQLARTQTISFWFKTLEPHAILAYSYDTLTFNKLFYIALYHGNIFVQYNIGEALSEPLQTMGLRLNTGQWQNVTIDFAGLSASLKVNNLPSIYGIRHLSTNYIAIQGSNSFLFVGGVPSTTPRLIGGDFPVRTSLNGAFKDFRMNSIPVNFNEASIVDFHGLDLSGVTPPVQVLPPRPYPTQPAPTGMAPPATCQDPTLILPYPMAARYGATPNSYMAHQLTSSEGMLLNNRFIFSLAFRALSPNGILLYVANSNTLPSQFFSLLMMDGKLAVNLLTTSRSRNGLNVMTNERYDNGEWQEITLIRVNDFVAILVENTGNYISNQVSWESVSSGLSIGTNVYVGGIGPEVIMSGIMETRPFDGCIRNVEIQFGRNGQAPINLNHSNAVSERDVRSCSVNRVELGGYFNGSGWLLLKNNFQVGNNLDISFTIATITQNALLLAVSANEENFFAMDIYNGMVRAVVSHGQQSSYIIRSNALGEFGVCDNLPHTVHLTFTTATLTLTVDDHPSDVTTFDAGSPNVRTNNGLYIGGIPDTSTVPLISGIAVQPFHGCIQNMLINNATTDFRNNLGSAAFMTGCPRPL